MHPQIVNMERVPPYTVRCLDLDPVARADGHHHVTAIETGDPDGGRTRWTLVQVIEAVRDGEQFVIEADADRQVIDLAPSVCPRCHMATLTPASEVTLGPCS